MKIELLLSQISDLAEFIEDNFISYIKDTVGVGNMEYVVDMCDTYKILREIEKQGVETTINIVKGGAE